MKVGGPVRFPWHAFTILVALLPLDYAEANGLGRIIFDNELHHRLVDLLPAGVKLSAIVDCHSNSTAVLDLNHYTCNNVYVPWVIENPVLRRNARWVHTAAPGMEETHELKVSRQGYPHRATNSHSSKPLSELHDALSLSSEPELHGILVPRPRRLPASLLVANEDLGEDPERHDGVAHERHDGVAHERSRSVSVPRSLRDPPSTPTDILEGHDHCKSPQSMLLCDGWCRVEPARGSSNVVRTYSSG